MAEQSNGRERKEKSWLRKFGVKIGVKDVKLAKFSINVFTFPSNHRGRKFPTLRQLAKGISIRQSLGK